MQEVKTIVGGGEKYDLPVFSFINHGLHRLHGKRTTDYTKRLKIFLNAIFSVFFNANYANFAKPCSV